MFSSLFFVSLLATLSKSFQMDLHEIFTEGWQWANEQMIKFWWLSGSPILFRIHHYWEIQKMVNKHKPAATSSHSFIPIHQMAELISQHW